MALFTRRVLQPVLPRKRMKIAAREGGGQICGFFEHFTLVIRGKGTHLVDQRDAFTLFCRGGCPLRSASGRKSPDSVQLLHMLSASSRATFGQDSIDELQTSPHFFYKIKRLLTTCSANHKHASRSFSTLTRRSRFETAWWSLPSNPDVLLVLRRVYHPRRQQQVHPRVWRGSID